MDIEKDTVHIGTQRDPYGKYYEGDDAIYTFPVTDPDGNEVDVSSADSIEWGFKEEDFYDGTIVSYTVSGGGITVTDNDGELSKQSYVEVRVQGNDTVDLGGYDYFHRLIITDSEGSKQVAAAGEYYISNI